MLKVAAAVMDVYTDLDGSVARSLPAELHELKVTDYAELASLHDWQFGLVIKTASGVQRRFPLHTDDAIKLSKAYFDKTKNVLHPAFVLAAEEKLKDPSSKKVAYVDATILEPQRAKVAFKERVWGLTIDGQNCFPLHDETLTKTAIERYPGTMVELEPLERFIYARNIEKRASQLGISIPTSSPIRRYTSGAVNKVALRHAIEQRKEAVGGSRYTEVLDQLATAAGCAVQRGDLESDDSFAQRAKLASKVTPIDAERIIGILQNFDKLAGLGQQDYLRGLADPFAACFSKAAYQDSNMIVDGVDLSGVQPEMLAQAQFDTEFIHSFMQNPCQVYMSLPAPVKAIVRDVANGTAGEAPKSITSMFGGAGECQPPVSGGDPSDVLNPSFSNPLA